MHSGERREFLGPALLALLSCWLGPAATAGGQPVRMIVPLAPGTTADFVARVLGQRLALATGRPVVVENQPAAAGVPATADRAARRTARCWAWSRRTTSSIPRWSSTCRSTRWRTWRRSP